MWKTERRRRSRRLDWLPPEQVSQADDWCRRWEQLLLSTVPADRPRAEEAVRRVCASVGIDSDRQIIWLKNPVLWAQCSLAAHAREVWEPVARRLKQYSLETLYSAPPACRGSKASDFDRLLMGEVIPPVFGTVPVNTSVPPDEMVANELCAVYEVVFRSSAFGMFSTSFQSLAMTLRKAFPFPFRGELERTWDRAHNRWRGYPSNAWEDDWPVLGRRILALVEDAVCRELESTVRSALTDALPGPASMDRSVGRLLGYSLRDVAQDALQITGTPWTRSVIRFALHCGTCPPVGQLPWRTRPRFSRLPWRHFMAAIHATFMREVCRADVGPPRTLVRAVLDLAASCWAFSIHRDVILLCDRPEQIAVDPDGQPHNETGPAIRSRDGWALWCLHGLTIPEEAITSPRSLTSRQIDAVENAEVRRALIERCGADRYLRDGGAMTVHTDRYGTLYRKPAGNGEPQQWVRVVNSTPEPDGTFREYFLRVPPDVRTAHEAVAWTFGFDRENADLYRPIIET